MKVNPSFCYLFRSSTFLESLYYLVEIQKRRYDQLDKNEIMYGMTDNFTRHLGLSICITKAKYYIHITSRKEE